MRPARSTPPRRGVSAGIGLKAGALIAALVVVLASSSALLVSQNRATAREYDDILNREVRQGLLTRQMQVEFKKRVQEWKDLLLRGSDPTERARYLANFDEQDEKVDDLYRQLLATDPDVGLRTQLQRFADLERQVDAGYERALTAFVTSGGTDVAAADRSVRGIDRPATDQVDQVVTGLEARIAWRTAAQERLIAERQRLAVMLSGSVLVLLSSLLGLALIRIVRPIRTLTRQAQQAAAEGLPDVIARIKTMRPDDEPPTLPRFPASTSDELEDLARALTSLQDSALALAIEQHRSDRETAAMLVNLGRRNQNLLGRMLSYVTELERGEEDPDVLAQLFRLDHATTRIRRNAESMLVLAGAAQTRTWSRPVPVIDVVRSALSEIEEYTRVELHHLEDGLVNGSVVADAAHLIAELVENATHFSPPTTQVTVIGRRVREGYRLRVIDQGVGMTRGELDAANQRIRRGDGGWYDSKLLGLHVVGRLARRRGIEVALEPSAGRGITASILLPLSALPSSTSQASLSSSASSEASSDPGSAVEPNPTIDLTDHALTDHARTGGRDLLPTGAVPVQWFNHEVVPPSTSGGASGASGPGGPCGGGDSRRLTVGGPAPVIPRRVRGAQLPDLGPAAEPLIARPEDGPGTAESLRWQLRSFQLDVQAARRAISESDPVADVPREASPTRPTDGEPAEPAHGHHHREGE